MDENFNAKHNLVAFCEKKSLVNETLKLETETRPRRLTFSSRRDRDQDVPTFHRDRDVWKMRLETETSRPRLYLWTVHTGTFTQYVWNIVQMMLLNYVSPEEMIALSNFVSFHLDKAPPFSTPTTLSVLVLVHDRY